jgi:hypothetical protein
VLCSVVAPPALAQDDRAAGLFAEARQLPLVEQAVRVNVAGGEARVELVQVFANDGEDVAQADFLLELPREAVVTGFGFWQGDRYLASGLKEKGEAKAAHAKAATAGRATGLSVSDRNMQSFSVYPVKAGERKRIKVELSLPVETEAGQSQVRLPIDRFGGAATPSTPVVVRLRTAQPLLGLGADGADRTRAVTRRERTATLVFTGRRGATVWWKEEAPPLLVRAERAALEEGGHGTGLTIALNDAAPWGVGEPQIKLLLDGSFSMRRKRGALVDTVQRILSRTDGDVSFFAAAERTRPLSSSIDARALVDEALDGQVGFVATWPRMARWLSAQRCDAPSVRCAVITDAQLEGAAGAAKSEHPVLFLASPDALAWVGDGLGDAARVYQPGVDPPARLHGLADELVLPALRVISVEAQGAPLPTIGKTRGLVVEGGRLRMYTDSAIEGRITVAMSVGGRALERTVDVEALPASSPEASALRRAIYQRTLRAWMKRYRDSNDYALKDKIVALSVREGIPTALTALHVEDPSLSLYAIKPGDPLLAVAARECVEEVAAFYPFGTNRSLTMDAANGRFIDRFLVPRGWAERAYRVDVFERCDDGSVTRRHAWYRLDERGPGARISVDEDTDQLVVMTRDTAAEIGSVLIEGATGTTLRLSPVGEEWRVSLADLPSRFVVKVRDRAGNRTRFDCELDAGSLRVLDDAAPPVLEAKTAPAAVPTPVTFAGVRGARVSGARIYVARGADELSFARSDVELRSLDITAMTTMGKGRWLVGTRAGDLVRLRCDDTGRCTARRVSERFRDHPVTGLVHFGGERVLVGVLGQGLFDVKGAKVRRARWRVGSRFITSLLAFDGEILVGTSYNGLWRITRSKAHKTGFPHEHVATLSTNEDGVVVGSGYGQFARRARDRYVRVEGPVTPARVAHRFVAAANVQGRAILGSFDRGLFEQVGAELKPLDVALGDGEARHINALEVVDGRLWVATQDGLFTVDVDARTATRRLDGPVFDLSSDGTHLAAAAKKGLWVASEGGELARIDAQSGATTGRFGAVTFHDGALITGGLDGLARFDRWQDALHGGARATGVPLGSSVGFDAGWVTALLSDGERLLVGTYDEGVWQLVRGAAVPVAGLESWWVPFGALQRSGDAIFVGGLGMPSARLKGSVVTAVSVPAADTFATLHIGGVQLLLTNEGIVRTPGRRVARAFAD